ncbi:dirigent protein 11-like [Salvia miltiorrhiza]|uniref:dirigent protein 11-like n=1 Tax=Salvia miltiorrhiza TaxID=226208 RepID=UPI0025ABF346|nr:dirigent protein 11-like [Salvia miltiorrhiza]
MAKLGSIGVILTISCLLASTLYVNARKQGLDIAEDFLDFPRKDFYLEKEKVVKFRVFVQDLSVNHPNTTTYDVAQASITATSPTGFGKVRVIDDLVTAQPNGNSRALGRLQGLLTRSDLTTLAISVNLNLYFSAGPYAGSIISLLGRNQIALAERELVVAGGTGVFRFARGYAIQKTNSTRTNVSVLEYNIYTTYNAKLNEVDEM